tara:strand:+ start:491 stop:736 length:246 start_codon:yes stop_codon:yes gene_type:complete
MKQPLAFRLAKRLERQRGDIGHAVLMLHSADELRRLHEVNAELLSALNTMLTEMGMDENEWNKPTYNQARDAIAKATGETE